MLGSMVRTTSLALLLAGATLFAQAPQQGNKPAEPAKQAKPPAESLEDVINQALRNNPDIRVAEAKVREAEANLNKTRIAVAQKAVDLSHSINVAKKTCEEAKQNLAKSNNLDGARSAEENRGAKLTVEKYEAEQAKLEAELAALLGKMPGKPSEPKQAQSKAVNQATESALRWLNAQQAARPDSVWLPEAIVEEISVPVLKELYLAANIKAPQGSIAVKIRKALETPITIQIAGQPVAELMQVLQKHTGGDVVFRNTADDQIVGSSANPLDLKEVPVATVLQAISDETYNTVAFVVRDYGILAVNGDHLPPGTLRVDEFMKRNAAKDKPASGATDRGKK